MTVRNLTKHFRVRGTKFRSAALLQAVNGVDFDLRAGRCLALVGESGCGKTTLARLLLRLEDATAGSITLNGQDITGLDEKTDAPASSPSADGLPGSLLVAQPPPVGRRDHRRAADRAEDPRPPQSGPGPALERQPRPCRERALRGGVLGRPASTDRHRPGTGARAERRSSSTSPSRRWT